MFSNLLFCDGYKISQGRQYPPNTTEILSYIESRGGYLPSTVFFGLQIYAANLAELIVTKEMVNEAKAFADQYIDSQAFPYLGWMKVVNEHKGKIPLEIRAVREGTTVPTHNVLVTVRSTDEELPWMVNYLETSLMRAIWFPVNVATISNNMKKIIYEYLIATSDEPDVKIPLMTVDFGARGVSSGESAAIGGCAHLANFMVSDTIEGIVYANKYYNNGEMSGFSINAAEHSTITAWGKEHEADAYRNMLKQYAKPGGLVAVVSDAWDLDNAVINIWGSQLKQEVIDSGATLVVRPDSGEKPHEIVLRTLKNLDNAYGSTINSKGYKVLNHVRVIQGDGITEGEIRLILMYVKRDGFSVDNLTFGCGGVLLQQHNRDTFKFAMKCCQAVIDNKKVDVYKDPITDPSKRSKAGNLDLIKLNGQYLTIDRNKNEYPDIPSELDLVYRNGTMHRTQTLTEIRAQIDKDIKAGFLVNA